MIKLILAIAVYLISILLFLGRLPSFIAGYNTLPDDQKQEYDSKRLGKVVGSGMFVIVTLSLVNEQIEKIIGYESGWMPWIIAVIALIMVILANTVCKNK